MSSYLGGQYSSTSWITAGNPVLGTKPSQITEKVFLFKVITKTGFPFGREASLGNVKYLIHRISNYAILAVLFSA